MSPSGPAPPATALPHFSSTPGAAAAGEAYRRGAGGYGEWSLLQAERARALRQQLELAVSAWIALIEIQRLTGSTYADGAPARDNGGN